MRVVMELVKRVLVGVSARVFSRIRPAEARVRIRVLRAVIPAIVRTTVGPTQPKRVAGSNRIAQREQVEVEVGLQIVDVAGYRAGAIHPRNCRTLALRAAGPATSSLTASGSRSTYYGWGRRVRSA